jgi:hypothetical protein
MISIHVSISPRSIPMPMKVINIQPRYLIVHSVLISKGIRYGAGLYRGAITTKAIRRAMMRLQQMIKLYLGEHWVARKNSCLQA